MPSYSSQQLHLDGQRAGREDGLSPAPAEARKPASRGKLDIVTGTTTGKELISDDGKVALGRCRRRLALQDRADLTPSSRTRRPAMRR